LFLGTSKVYIFIYKLNQTSGFLQLNQAQVNSSFWLKFYFSHASLAISYFFALMGGTLLFYSFPFIVVFEMCFATLCLCFCFGLLGLGLTLRAK